MKHRGDLTITADNAAMYSDLTEVTGCLYLSEGASLTAPGLTTLDTLDLRRGASLTAPGLTTLRTLYLSDGASLTAPGPTTLDTLHLSDGASLTAPGLTTLRTLHLSDGASLTAPELTTLRALYLRRGASLTAPGLTIAGRSLPTPEVAVERIRAVAAEALLTPQALDMTQWHRCATTHCIAGWAIHQAGSEGYKLEREVGSATAGAILLGTEAAAMFHTSTATARKWLEGFISNPTPEAV